MTADFIRQAKCVLFQKEAWRLYTAATQGSASGRVDSLQQCLEHLPEGTRQPLETRYVKGFSIREMSAKSGKGYAALALQIHRLR